MSTQIQHDRCKRIRLRLAIAGPGEYDIYFLLEWLEDGDPVGNDTVAQAGAGAGTTATPLAAAPAAADRAQNNPEPAALPAPAADESKTAGESKRRLF